MRKLTLLLLAACVLPAAALPDEDLGGHADLKAAEAAAESATQEAKRAAEAARPEQAALESPKVYAGCVFQSDKKIELVLMHPQEKSLADAGVVMHRPNENTVQFLVEEVHRGGPQPAFEDRVLRIQETGKDRRIMDILLAVRHGHGYLRLGESEDGSPEKFELDESLFMAGMDLTGRMRFQFTKSFSWGFLGMGGKTLLAIGCQVPMAAPQ